MFSSGKMVSYEVNPRMRRKSLIRAANSGFRLSAASIVLIVFNFVGLHSRAVGQDLLAEKIHSWNFQKAEDQNSDYKPDGWRRLHDRNHPKYIDLTIKLRDESSGMAAKRAQVTLAKLHRTWETGQFNPHYVPEVMPKAISAFMDRFVLHKCLHVDMDGGSAERVSPEFPIDARFAYSLRGQVRTQNLLGHQAWIELHLLDEELNTVEVLSTKQVRGDTNWRDYETEVASEPASELKWGRIHIKVEPLRSLHYVGSASFDKIEVYRLPRLSLTTQIDKHIATPGVPFDVLCTAMGLRHENTSVKFTLHDYMGEQLESASVPLQRLMFDPSEATPTKTQNGTAGAGTQLVKKTSRVFDGAAAWHLTLNDPGLYRVRVDLGSGSIQSRQREILLAVMPPGTTIVAGPFGWSIPEFDSVVQPEDLPRLVRMFGAAFVKIPVWFDEGDSALITRLTKMIDRLQSSGTICIGRLDNPPASFGLEHNEQTISLALLRKPDNWEPMIAPVLTRLGMKITWFQLGSDSDLSLMSHDDVTSLMQDIRQRMQTYSQELKLSLNWDWFTAQPNNPASTWNAVHSRAQPQLTADELTAYLEDTTAAHDTWISFDPLDSEKYSLLDRVRDLTERAIAIKKSNVKAAFLSNPFDARHGLFSADGSVGEMLLPWHTLVSNLGPAAYLGSIQMPGDTENHIFQRGETGLMLLWNDTPVKETIYLGEDVTATDIWGRPVEITSEVSPISQAVEQVIEVNAWPIIIWGVNVQVAQWRQRFQLGLTNLGSTLGVSQMIPLSIENTFVQTANVKMNLHSPKLVSTPRAVHQFELATQRRQDRYLPINIRNDASAGEHQMRFNFDVAADRRYRFSVYRSIVLGLGDVEFTWDAVRMDDNSVKLSVELMNHSAGDVSFDCKIFPSGQAYQRLQIVSAAPGATQKQITVRGPTTSEGGIWIRCEQIGTGRILNYRVQL